MSCHTQMHTGNNSSRKGRCASVAANDAHDLCPLEESEGRNEMAAIELDRAALAAANGARTDPHKSR